LSKPLALSSDLLFLAIPLPENGHVRGSRPELFGAEGFGVAVMRVREHIDLELHTHDFFELVLILGGEAVHRTEDGSYPLVAGDAFLIKPGVAHGYVKTRELELCNILFAPERLSWPEGVLSGLPGYHALFDLEPSFRDLHRFQSRLFLPPRMREEVVGWVELLAEELSGRADGYEQMSLALLIRIIGLLSRCYAGMATPASRTLLAVNKVVSHMESHYAEALPLPDLARMAHMSPRNLQRYFQRAFGVTPLEYLNRVRIRRACGLLEEGLGVTQVADAVGLADSSYFARVFRRFTGVSPTRYRQLPRLMRQELNPGRTRHP
jgi:AraC-like DNA-binding protein/quercetin dioxygenase-like cupin family protein